ncbi:hypothetical protein EST38_g3475 [Candolleomyces aberdarensis]|uniref:Uncharacterized protein n=1 Tax=Candolleomyces aberdarensis TaxID=2316362 RepID=A0A4Q2DQ90_9AGAR|nr:hypothetical protein EST38_g3475 [Candolleomyces aberdarensis]
MAGKKSRGGSNRGNSGSAQAQAPPGSASSNELGELRAELERLRQAAAEAQAQVAEAQAAADEARAQAQAAQVIAAAQPLVTQSQVVPLPRPHGQTFNVQSAMGLEDDDELYGSIQRTVRRAVVQAGIDLHSSLRAIPPEKLAAVYKKVRDTHPYMDRRRFPSDWPTLDLMKQYLRNHRKYSRKKGRLGPYNGAAGRANRAGGTRHGAALSGDIDDDGADE